MLDHINDSSLHKNIINSKESANGQQKEEEESSIEQSSEESKEQSETSSDHSSQIFGKSIKSEKFS